MINRIEEGKQSRGGLCALSQRKTATSIERFAMRDISIAWRLDMA